MFSLQVDPIISTSARSIITSSQRCLFHPSPSCLCFPSIPPFSSRNQISYSSILLFLGSLFILFFQCSTRWFTWRCSSSSSFLTHFSSPVVPIQAFGVDHILFRISNTLSCRCTSLSFHFSLFIIRSAEDVSEDSCFHSAFVILSSSFEIVISF